eukprot:gi/632961280/ref/XP_007896665.1/ PREDICTED: kinesin-like protein KIF26B [Callorhinchus milii]
MCETGSRPAPEGGGSVPGSGTASPGSSGGSPGSSFTGSPGSGGGSPGSLAGSSPGSGTGSPGSGTGSPGSGTGSPGSGTGSPGSSTGSPGSGTGSPGSFGSEDKGIWCENCNTRLVELKRQALKMMIPGAFSSKFIPPSPPTATLFPRHLPMPAQEIEVERTSLKDPAFSALIHDKLQVPNTTRRAWNERDNRCDICATHLNQLKQEAIQMVQTLEQAATLEQYDASPGSPPLSNIPSLVGSRNIGSLQAS